MLANVLQTREEYGVPVEPLLERFTAAVADEVPRLPVSPASCVRSLPLFSSYLTAVTRHQYYAFLHAQLMTLFDVRYLPTDTTEPIYDVRWPPNAVYA